MKPRKSLLEGYAEDVWIREQEVLVPVMLVQ